MRIAIISNLAWNIYNFRLPVADAFIKEGHDVFLIAPPDDFVHKLQDYQFVPLNGFDRKGKNPLKDAKSIYNLRKIFKELNIDVVFSYTPKINIYSALAAKGTPTQVIPTITGLGYGFINDGVTNRIQKLLYKRALSHVPKVFFQNQDDQKLFIEQGIVKESITQIVPGSGVDADYFKPGPPLTEKPSVITFLFLSRLLKDKGVMEFLEAAQQTAHDFPNTRFELVGSLDSEGNPMAILQEELNPYLSEQIAHYGALPTEEVRDRILQSHVVVLPSYREGMPRVILEAMACAKPIIVTDVPGCRDLVQYDNGFMVRPYDANDLMHTFVKFINLPINQWNMMGENGRNAIEEIYEVNKITAVYLELLKQIN